MKWVKQSVGYWCDDIKQGRCIGQGVCVALLDTGIARHPDLKGSVVKFCDFTKEGSLPGEKCYDHSGHGTHVAGILCGSGKVSAGAYAGMAPKAKLVVGKVLDKDGNGDVSHVMKGIEWILKERKKYGIRIVNISVGTNPGLAKKQKELLLDAVELLWDTGLTVVVSAGNYGPEEGTVAVPGNSRKVITVGVPDSNLPYSRKSRKSLNYSGRGPTGECVVKPDVFAPGTGVVSCNSMYGMSGEHPYIMKTGTSMAAPVVSGAAACLLSKYPDMTNVEIKLKLRESCVKMKGTESGWGMLHVGRLLGCDKV